MRLSLNVVTAITAVTLSVALGACYCALADQPRHHERVVYASVDDRMVQTLGDDLKADIDSETRREWALEVEIERETGGLPAMSVDVEPLEAENGGEWGYDSPDGETGPQIGSQGLQGNPDGLNSYVGVVEYDGHVETAYSSNVAYHVDTAQWTPDEQGFYRTDEGYYVVASSDYEHGTIIDTSQGKAMVLDDGCSSGVVDFYTDWQ